MDPNTLNLIKGAAGAGDDKIYVDDVFSTFVYVGNGAARAINNGIDLDGEGGMVWIKNRDDALTHHNVFDTINISSGAGHALLTNNAMAMQDFGSTSLTGFNNNGFSFGGGQANVNADTDAYVSWSFRKAPGFFDIVTYTGNGVEGRDLAHSLGSVPGMMIVKNLDTADDWRVYHRELSADETLRLSNENAATSTTGASTFWNGTRPTASVFTVGNQGGTNEDEREYVCYLFAHDDQQFGKNGDEAIIKCGIYTGNGTAGHTIDLGFEPQYLLLKASSNTVADTTHWYIFDHMRSFYATEDVKWLEANDISAEQGNVQVNRISTGFVINENDSDRVNGTGDDYIYMAIRSPNKPPEAGTEVYETLKYTGNATARQVATTIAADTIIAHRRSGSQDHFLFDRLRGSYRYMRTSTTAAEASQSSAITTIGNNHLDMGSGSIVNDVQAMTDNMCLHMFRRAPGFFDIVCYTGTGSTQTVTHNLGVAPELLIVKNRDNAKHWNAYVASQGNPNFIEFDNDAALTGHSNRWNNTSPTSSVFTVESADTVNGSGDEYIAYLFATLPGISKVGTYDGTGNDIDVDCGFTAGARLVIAKRTDAAGDWYIWDTTRGIVSGDDPLSVLNNTAAELTDLDFIDPLNAGFTITSGAPDALNESGGEYIYLAIA